MEREKLSWIQSHLKKQEEEIKHFSDVCDFFVLRNYTIEPMEPYLRYELSKWSIRASFSYSHYEDALEALNKIQRGQISEKYILIDLSYDELLQKYGNLGGVEAFLDSLLEKVKLTEDKIFLWTLFSPGPKIRDLYYRDFGLRREINRLNEKIRKQMQDEVAHFVDMDNLTWYIGAEESLNRKFFGLFQAPYSEALWHAYAKDIASHIRYWKGHVYKVLVVDADNTLWGGVIGEAGLDGILLDPHRVPGIYYYNFQMKLKMLLERGYLLALNSKNNEEDVLSVLSSHPHSILKKEDFSSLQINWNRKDENMMQIGKELNLGLSSFIFFDDNPSECELIRQVHPEIKVVEMKNPERIDTLFYELDIVQNPALSLGYEDKKQKSYNTEALRIAEKKQFHDIKTYLKSLEIVLTLDKLHEKNLHRAAELCAKTNQFNFTTQRYTKEDIEAMSRKENYFMRTLFVQDKYGDYGQTGLIILKKEEEAFIIDTFLMSCRILGKEIERDFLWAVLKAATEAYPVNAVIGQYIKTPKNVLVSNFYKEAGFQKKEPKKDREEFILEKVPVKIDKNFMHQIIYKKEG